MGPPKFLALLLAAVVACTPVPAIGRTHNQAGQTVRACTFNVWRHLPPAANARDIDRLADSCGLIAMQETNRDSRAQLTPPGWALARPTRARGLAITYRPGTWTLGASGAVLAERSDTFPGDTRWFTWARFRAKATGLALTVIDAHSVPHVELNGHPRRLPRIAVYRRWLEVLGGLVRAQPGPVLVLGDFNVAAGPDCRVRFRWFPCTWAPRVGLANVWHVLGGGRGTHGRRTIDYALDRGRRTTPLTRRVLSGYRSDHRPVVVRYRLTR